jgi:hypothetical protein
MTEWEAIAKRLRVTWAKIPGIVDVRIRRRKDGAAAVYVRTRGGFPRGLPAAVSVKVGITSLVLPVLWAPVVEAPPVATPQHHDLPITRDMWGGAPPVVDRMLPVIDPIDVPKIPTGGLPPPVGQPDMEVFLPVRDPRLPFWTKPFDLNQCVCLTRLGVPTMVLSVSIPQDQMLTLTGISYNIFGAAVFDRLRISVSRSLSEQATWDDMVMANAADDAHQFAFSGHLNPMPLNLIVDHDNELTVTVTALGGPPYTPIPTPTNLQVCVLLRGWISLVNDARSGAPKSFDIGVVDEIAFGDRDVVGEFKDAALAAAVQQAVEENAKATGVVP